MISVAASQKQALKLRFGRYSGALLLSLKPLINNEFSKAVEAAPLAWAGTLPDLS